MRSCARFLFAGLLVLASLQSLAAADESALLAKEHFHRGTKLYDLGHYLEAAAEYERAYEAKESPALLYNLGQAYRLAGEHQKALGAYRSYLRHLPEAPNRAEVLGFIDALKRTLEAQKQAQEKPPTAAIADKEPAHAEPHPAAEPLRAPPPSVVTPSPSLASAPAPPDPQQLARGRTLRRAGIGVTSFGVAALVTGGVFAGLTANVSHQLSSPTPTANGLPAYSRSLESRGHVYQALSIAGFAVGGAAVVGGVTAILLGTRKIGRNRFALSPAVGAGHLGAAVSGSF